MKCQKCGNNFDGNFCPNCGTGTQNDAPFVPAAQAKQKKKKSPLKVVIIVLAVIVAIGVIGGNSDKTESSSQAGSTSNPSASKAADTSVLEADYWLPANTYIVGKDIEPGEYIVEAKSGNCYVEVTKDSSGTFDSIIANTNTSSHIYLDAIDGTYIKVQGGKIAKAADVSPYVSKDGVFEEGMYKAGKDIQAGEYLVESVSGNCYVEVCNDARGIFASIAANTNTSTRVYVTVADGQYIRVNGGTFIFEPDAQPYVSNDGTYDDGMYKVGKDIPAGEYKITADDSNCYIQVSSDSSGSFSSIVSNDNIGLGESAYITVGDGQYLLFTGGKIK